MWLHRCNDICENLENTKEYPLMPPTFLKLPVICLLVNLVLVSCNEIDLTPLEFIDVQTKGAEAQSYSSVELIGELTGGDIDESALASYSVDYGFVLSTDPEEAFLGSNCTCTESIPLGPGLPGAGGEFRSLLEDLSLKKTYHYRAYVILEVRGKRRVIEGELRTFSLSGTVVVSITSPLIENNQATLSGSVDITQPGNPIENGFVYRKLADPDVIDAPDLNTDIVLPIDVGDPLLAILNDLDFNTCYAVWSYAKMDETEDNLLFSPVRVFCIQDGWKLILRFTGIGLTDNIGIARDSNNVYFGLGCSDPCDLDGDDLGTGKLWKWDPLEEGAEPELLINDGGPFGRNGSVSFIVGDKLFYGLGEIESLYLSDFWMFDLDSEVWSQVQDIPGGGRNNAVAFTKSGKGYVGTGWILDQGIQNEDNAFFEFMPEGVNGPEWTALNSKPQVLLSERSPDPIDAGRTGATAFAGDSLAGAYVGYGQLFGSDLRDIVRFDLGAGTGSEEFSPPMEIEIPAREDPVSFVLGKDVYIGFGRNDNSPRFDVWKWDTTTDTTDLVVPIPEGSFSPQMQFSFAFSLQGRGYVGGWDRTIDAMLIFEYTPLIK